MPNDNISLVVGNQELKNFKSIKVDSDMFVGGDRFRFDVNNSIVEIEAGQECSLLVNGFTELVGVIDRVKKRYIKNQGKTTIIEGRDLMGLVVDSFIDSFDDFQDVDLDVLAETLLQDIPFVNTKDIVVDVEASKNSNAKAIRFSTQQKKGFGLSQTQSQGHLKINPGDTYFQVLSNAAQKQGLLFYYMPDGTFIFGKPRSFGSPEFSLSKNNILAGDKDDDISGRYSRVIVLGQAQAEAGSFSLAASNIKGEAVDPSFPFTKTFITESQTVGVDPASQAFLIMSNQIFKGFNLNYTVPGFTQGGKNWQVNSIVEVQDLVNNVRGNFLVYGRTFRQGKQGGTIGTFTDLRLSKLGFLPST